MSQEESRKRKSEVFEENDSEESSSEPQSKSSRLSQPLKDSEVKSPNLEENLNGENLSSSPPAANLVASDDDVELIDATDAKNEDEYLVHCSNSEEEPSTTENAPVEPQRNTKSVHSSETNNEAIVVHSSSDSDEIVVDGDTPEKKFINPFESVESSQESLELSVGQPSPQKNCENTAEAAESSPEDMNLVVDADSPEKVSVVVKKTSQVIEQTGESSDANDAIILQSSPESEIIVVDDDKFDQNNRVGEQQVTEIARVVEIETSQEIPVSGNSAAIEDETGDYQAKEDDKSPKIVPDSTNNTRGVISEPSCSISIRFQDESIADMYRLKFLDFISTVDGLQIKSSDKLTIDICHADNSHQNFVANEEEVVSHSSTHTEVVSKHSPKKHKKKNKTKRELFMVDATPSPQTSKTQEPQYITKFTLNLDAEKSTEAKESVSKQACFNCGGKHSVRECPIPKDYGKINAARQRFGRQQAKSSRYHLEEDQKYSHLAPGKLSNELRKALGLRRNEMPDYIYKMRRLGYPPGWLEEAKHVCSNLGMFGIDGKHVKEDPKQKKRGLDVDKIVDYPGFNVPPEPGMRDDFRAFGVPPYNDDFSKEAMINYFNNLQQEEPETTSPPTTHRNRRKETAVNNDEEEERGEADGDDSFVVVDMDVSASSTVAHENSNDDDDDSNDDNSFQLPAPPGTEERTAAAAAAALVELEEKKHELLKKLEDVDSPGKDYLAVKTTHFGTPILKSSSPYMRLPHADNFSKDVSPVINFENLPNSTGKYEQMTDVLQKVRTTLKKLQDCNM